MELPGHCSQSPSGQQKWETHSPTVTDEQGTWCGTEPVHQAPQKLETHAGHVAGQEKDCIAPRGLQGCMDAAHRAAAWHKIAPDDPHRPTRGPGRCLDLAQHRSVTKPQLGFIPAHPPAQAAGQDANLKADWQIHRFCLMQNHFHLVVQTQHASLVAGTGRRVEVKSPSHTEAEIHEQAEAEFFAGR